MSKRFEGMLLGKGLKFGLVVSRFNEFITNRLLEEHKMLCFAMGLVMKI